MPSPDSPKFIGDGSQPKSGPIAKACDYLQKTQQKLSNGYRWEDSGAIASCSGIAKEVAEILLPEQPSLLHVRGGTGPYAESLIPKCYEGIDDGFGGRVGWGNHIVCAVEKTVFDPIVGKPVDLETYATTVFEGPVTINEHVPSEAIADYLKDPLSWYTRKNRR